MHSLAYLSCFVRYGFTRSATFRTAWIASMVATTFQAAIVISLWTALYANDTEIGYSFDQIINYSLFTLFIWICVDTRIVRDIERDVREGFVERTLLRPVSLPAVYFATAVGKVAFNITVLTPAFVFLILLWQPSGAPDLSLMRVALTIVSVISASMIVVLIDVSVGLSSFWTINVFGIDLIKENLIRLLSGSTVPLFFYPEFLQKIIVYLPFAVIFYEPGRLFVAQAEAAQYATLFAQQIFWIVCLSLVMCFVSSRVRHVTAIAGG